jgi:hypothetical protein
MNSKLFSLFDYHLMSGSSCIQGKCSIIRESIVLLEVTQEMEWRGFTNVIFKILKNVTDVIHNLHIGVLELVPEFVRLKTYPNFVAEFIKRQPNMIVRMVISWYSWYNFEIISPYIKLLLLNEMSWVCYCKKKVSIIHNLPSI